MDQSESRGVLDTFLPEILQRFYQPIVQASKNVHRKISQRESNVSNFVLFCVMRKI